MYNFRRYYRITDYIYSSLLILSRNNNNNVNIMRILLEHYHINNTTCRAAKEFSRIYFTHFGI